MFGSHYIPARKWAPHIEVSGENVGEVPHEELKVDPYLPALAVDPFDPAGAILIPSGRFVSTGYSRNVGGGNNAYRFGRVDTGKTTLTMHDGYNLTPVGMSINQMYKDQSEFMVQSNTVKFRKRFMAEVPFVLSINNANGTLDAGDFCTGYWGSTTSTSIISYRHRGKPVKWLPKTVYTQTCPVSSACFLSAATLPGIQPEVIAGFNAAGAIVPAAASATKVWTGTNWQLSFTGAASAITTVVYNYGQTAEQIAGQVLRIQSVSDLLNRDNFLRWVELAPMDQLNFPPAVQRQTVTAVSNETPSTVSAGVQYRVLSYPMSLTNPVVVQIKGDVVDTDGNSTTYSSDWFTLPTNTTIDARGFFMGTYHTVNWRTGIIDLSSNITSITSIRVSYSYVVDPRDSAVVWGAGVQGLTDGLNVTDPRAGQDSAPAYGLEAYLNQTDVVASMRVMVK